MKQFLVILLLLFITSFAFSFDLNDPPWESTLPNQTSQTWEFSASSFLGNPWEPFIDENPYGTAYIEQGPFTWPDPVLGPEDTVIDTLHIDAPGGLTIWIPNNPDENLKKYIFWQVTSDKSPTPTGTGPTTTTPSGSTGTNLPSPYPQIQHGGTWYTYNGLIEIVPNPEGEWITFDFLESTNIEQIVIDTICVPEPATLILLGVGALLLRSKK